MQAPSAGFDVSGKALIPVLVQAGIFVQSWQAATAGHWEVAGFDAALRSVSQGRRDHLFQIGTDDPASRIDSFDFPHGLAVFQCLNQGNQWNLVLAANDRICHFPEQIPRIDRGVKSIETDVTGRIGRPDQFSDPHTEPKCSMHGYGNSHERRAPNGLAIELLNCDVESGRAITGLFKKCDGLGNADRLMTKFITRDEKNGLGSSQRRSFFDGSAKGMHRTFILWLEVTVIIQVRGDAMQRPRRIRNRFRRKKVYAWTDKGTGAIMKAHEVHGAKNHERHACGPTSDERVVSREAAVF